MINTTLKVLKTQHNMKKKAIESNDSPQNIISEVASTASDSTAARLPAIRSMKRGITRHRQIKDHPREPLPRSINDLVIPENLKKTIKGYQFLLYDSGPESCPNRILIFGTERFLD